VTDWKQLQIRMRDEIRQGDINIHSYQSETINKNKNKNVNKMKNIRIY